MQSRRGTEAVQLATIRESGALQVASLSERSGRGRSGREAPHAPLEWSGRCFPFTQGEWLGVGSAPLRRTFGVRKCPFCVR
jgi:hypothetical protein